MALVYADRNKSIGNAKFYIEINLEFRTYEQMVNRRRTKRNSWSVSYRQLAIYLSDNIGQCQIPIHSDAMHPDNIVAQDAVHYQLVKSTLRTIYRTNRCYHLDAPISFLPTFDALGKIQIKLLESSSADIDQVNLLHQIGSCTKQLVV